jgi:hypothetical protein
MKRIVIGNVIAPALRSFSVATSCDLQTRDCHVGLGLDTLRYSTGDLLAMTDEI